MRRQVGTIPKLWVLGSYITHSETGLPGTLEPSRLPSDQPHPCQNERNTRDLATADRFTEHKG